jgi:hypothetical protein
MISEFTLFPIYHDINNDALAVGFRTGWRTEWLAAGHAVLLKAGDEARR